MLRQLLGKFRRKICPYKRGFFDAPELNSDDVFLVSYPRSGNTWVRNIIAHIQYPHDQIDALKDLNSLVPDIHQGIPDHNCYVKPRVIKTHRPYLYRHEPNNQMLYKRNIYVVRHPFDAMRSYFHYELNLWVNAEKSLHRFVDKVTSGNHEFGSWQEHVLSWKSMESELDILFLRYEDICKEPERIICDLAEFLGRSLSPREISAIQSRCNRKAMVNMEKKGSLVSDDYEFVRRDDEQRVMDQDLTLDMKRMILERSGAAMAMFNYGMK